MVIGDCLLAAPSAAPGASPEIACHGSTAFPVVATGALSLVPRANQRRLVVFPIERSASIDPFHFPRFPIRKETSGNKGEYRRKSADLF